MHFERAVLPGVGISHRFTTATGGEAGLISYPDGRRDLVVYDPHDPDTALHTVSLDRGEAQALAGLLEATVTVEHVAELERQLPGVSVVRIPVPAGSPADGRPWRDLAPAAKSPSLLAVIRDGKMIPTPGREFVLSAGDELVVAGSEAATAATSDVLTAG